ncbi:MAG TPA: hypothetical protein VGF67_08370 [Ktedonobacteraceae bacterium]|jgi:hypothetical protein
MKRQDQRLRETFEPRLLECSQERCDEQTTRLYRPPHVSLAGKAKRLMAAGNSGNNYDCIQRYYLC